MLVQLVLSHKLAVADIAFQSIHCDKFKIYLLAFSSVRLRRADQLSCSAASYGFELGSLTVMLMVTTFLCYRS